MNRGRRKKPPSRSRLTALVCLMLLITATRGLTIFTLSADAGGILMHPAVPVEYELATTHPATLIRQFVALCESSFEFWLRSQTRLTFLIIPPANRYTKIADALRHACGRRAHGVEHRTRNTEHRNLACQLLTPSFSLTPPSPCVLRNQALHDGSCRCAQPTGIKPSRLDGFTKSQVVKVQLL